jgi:surface protein
MFYGNSSFNQPINSWDVSNVTNMNSLFYATPFNQPLSGWNVSNVTDMNNMFRLSSFNQPINNWNVSKVTNMDSMFQVCPFNQPLNSWDVSKVTNMQSMFSNSPFDQNIGNWNVSGVTNFMNFMVTKTPATFSTTNLDAIYNGWSSLPSLQSSINISFGSAKYTAASSAGKSVLQTTYGWTITDGGI